MMEWCAVPLDKAKKIIAEGMNCPFLGEGLRISAISECLRAMAHLCSVPEAGIGTWEPAASVRLTGMTRHRLAQLWPDMEGDRGNTSSGVMDILDSLNDLGDMVRVEGGRWLAAPAHLVRVGNGLVVLLGGGPIEALPPEVAESAKVVGRARLVEEKACIGWTDVWDVDEWIGIAGESLDEWSFRVLADARMRLTEAPEELGDASAYLHRKWIGLADLPMSLEGLFLCRVRVAQSFSYFLGELIKGSLRRLSNVSSQDARRLRFYFDTQSGNPTKVIVTSSSQGIIKCQLSRHLPGREGRVLLLGWQVPAQDKELQDVMHFEFPTEMLPILRRAFEWLGVMFDERVSARR